MPILAVLTTLELGALLLGCAPGERAGERAKEGEAIATVASDGRVTVDANDAPRRVVLEVLAEEVGFHLFAPRDLKDEDKVTIHASDKSVADIVESIARGLPYMLSYRPSRDGSPQKLEFLAFGFNQEARAFHELRKQVRRERGRERRGRRELQKKEILERRQRQTGGETAPEKSEAGSPEVSPTPAEMPAG